MVPSIAWAADEGIPDNDVVATEDVQENELATEEEPANIEQATDLESSVLKQDGNEDREMKLGDIEICIDSYEVCGTTCTLPGGSIHFEAWANLTVEDEYGGLKTISFGEGEFTEENYKVEWFLNESKDGIVINEDDNNPLKCIAEVSGGYTFKDSQNRDEYELTCKISRKGGSGYGEGTRGLTVCDWYCITKFDKEWNSKLPPGETVIYKPMLLETEIGKSGYTDITDTTDFSWDNFRGGISVSHNQSTGKSTVTRTDNDTAYACLHAHNRANGAQCDIDYYFEWCDYSTVFENGPDGEHYDGYANIFTDAPFTATLDLSDFKSCLKESGDPAYAVNVDLSDLKNNGTLINGVSYDSEKYELNITKAGLKKIAEKFADTDRNPKISAEIVSAESVGGEHIELANTELEMNIRVPDYLDMFRDREMLKSDLLEYDESFETDFCCAEYPESTRGEIHISDVEIENPSGIEVLKNPHIEKYDSGNTWAICCNEYGTAKATYTYSVTAWEENDDNNIEKKVIGEFERTVNISVVEEVYDVELVSSTYRSDMLPGTSYTIYPLLRYGQYVEDGEDSYIDRQFYDCSKSDNVPEGITFELQEDWIELVGKNRDIPVVNCEKDETEYSWMITATAYQNLNKDENFFEGHFSLEAKKNGSEIAETDYIANVCKQYYGLDVGNGLSVDMGSTFKKDDVLSKTQLKKYYTDSSGNIKTSVISKDKYTATIANLPYFVTQYGKDKYRVDDEVWYELPVVDGLYIDIEYGDWNSNAYFPVKLNAIEKKELVVSLPEKTYGDDYNSDEIEVKYGNKEIFDWNDEYYSDEDYSHQISKDEVKDAGVYYVKIVGSGPYAACEGKAALTINPAEAEIHIRDAAMYSDGEYPEYNYGVTGLFEDDALGDIIIRRADEKTEKTPGRYKLTADYTENANYDVEIKCGYLTIRKAEENEINITDYNGVYDGNSHGISVATGLEGSRLFYSEEDLDIDSGEWLEDAPTFSETGEYTVYVKAEKDGVDTVLSYGEVNISPKPATIKIDDKYIKYNGAEPDYTGTVTGLDEASRTTANISYECDYSRGDDVGEYDITANYNELENYEIIVSEGTLYVSEASTNLDISTDSITIDKGTSSTFTVTAADSVKIDFENSDGDIASVKKDDQDANTYNVTGLELGVCRITVTASDANATHEDAGNFKEETAVIKVNVVGTLATCEAGGNQLAAEVSARNVSTENAIEEQVSETGNIVLIVEKNTSASTDKKLVLDISMTCNGEPFEYDNTKMAVKVQPPTGFEYDKTDVYLNEPDPDNPGDSILTKVKSWMEDGYICFYAEHFSQYDVEGYNQIAIDSVELASDSEEYSGNMIMPEIEAVSAGGTVLGTNDYSVQIFSDENCTGEPFNLSEGIKNVGDYWLKVYAENEKYKDATPVRFTITPADMNDVDVYVSDQVYTGKKIEPDVALMLGDNEIFNSQGEENKKGIKVSYGKNTDAGTGTVIVTDSFGNLGYGTKKVSFAIFKADSECVTPANLKAKCGQTLADIILPDGFAWVDSTTAVGEFGAHSADATYTDSDTRNYQEIEITLAYQVEHKLTNHTYPAGYLKNGKSYDTCDVCEAVVNYGQLPGYGAPAVKSFKVSKGKKCFTAKWKKQKKNNLKIMSGYQVQYSASPNMSRAVTVYAGKKSKSKKVKGLAKKQYYYVRARIYVDTPTGPVYSGWTAVKGVKTK